MQRSKGRGVPPRLASAQQKFAEWRRVRKRGARIPKALWSVAARLAVTYGTSRTAQTLGLDYYALKKQVELATSRNAQDRPAFVELPPTLAGADECVVELEDVRGTKMRMHLKGHGSPDLIALAQSFWNSGR